MLPVAPDGPALQGLHVPPPAWWPPAPAWWFAALLALAAAASAVWLAGKWRRKWLHKRRLRRSVDGELARLQREFDQHRDGARLAAGLSALLRRVARLRGVDDALQGDAWHAQLERLAPGELDESTLTLLAHAPYQRAADYDAGAVLTACRAWLHSAVRHAHA